MSSADSAFNQFHNQHYRSHNSARLHHLASLNLPLSDRSVLEPGAGIGDHTLFYLERGCHVTAIEPRPENCAAFRKHLERVTPGASARWQLIQGDVYQADTLGAFNIIHCYGLLYHLAKPGPALRMLAAHCDDILVLETCVSFGDEPLENIVFEPKEDLSQAVEGIGSRPTRPWVWRVLQECFPHVYTTATQPNHPEFPTDWRRPEAHHQPLSRAVFIGARHRLDSASFIPELPDEQRAIS
jgi:hypothetical protein